MELYKEAIETFQSIEQRAVKLKKAFEITEQKKWNTNIFAEELSVQLGHLSSLFINETLSSFRENNRVISSLSDEMADVLLQVLALSDRLNFKIRDLLHDCKEDVTKDLDVINKYDNRDFLLTFSTLLGQITESLMIKENYRFPQIRDEKYFIRGRIAVFLYVLFLFSKRNSISLEEAFEKMEKDAYHFLSNYSKENGNE